MKTTHATDSPGHALSKCAGICPVRICCRPVALARADGDDTTGLVAKGTWFWCWELFVRGVLSLDRRPRMTRLRPPPQDVGQLHAVGIRSTSLARYDPNLSAVVVDVGGEDNRDDLLAEIRKLARPEPSYGWLDGSRLTPGSARQRSSAVDAAQRQVQTTGLRESPFKHISTRRAKSVSKQTTQLRPTQQLPDGSGLLPASRVAPRFSNAAPGRPAVDKGWPSD